MFNFSEQFSAATRTSIDANLAIMSALTNQVLANTKKLVELNMTLTETSLEESSAAARQLISAKDAQEFFSLASAHAQPNADKALAYARHLASITSEAQAEFTKTTETLVADTNRKVVKFVDEVSVNAPAGSENAIALLKSAIGSANAGFQQINQSAKQVAETLEANMTSAVNQISQATAKVSKPPVRKAA